MRASVDVKMRDITIGRCSKMNLDQNTAREKGHTGKISSTHARQQLAQRVPIPLRFLAER